MAALQPLVEPNILKKRSKQFWHQSDRYLTIEQNWQKPRIISNRVQRRLKNNILMPKIDDGSSKETKYTLPIGFRKFLSTHSTECYFPSMTATVFVSTAVTTCKRLREQA
uniref:60S ribosomal protein L32-like n=1 Tax=Myodes glareolus TaxID=447135 RepID=UPI0020228595|nr:60S ribosomal protein L32-like [Myodes glareolus]